MGVSERVKINTLVGRYLVWQKWLLIVGELVADYDSDVTKTSQAYLIAVFDQLSEALTNNDIDTIQSSITRLQDSMEQVLAVNAEVGAKMNRLELTQKKLGVQIDGVKELLSFNEDVDLAEISMQIAMAENVYISSLMTGAKVIQPTLVEFLG